MGRKTAEKIACPEYDALLDGLEQARAKVKEQGKAAVGALFKAFFAEHPKVTAICWTQYTPYFNDGEPCEFSVGELHLATKAADWPNVSSLYDDEGEEGALFKDSYSLKGANKSALARLAASVDEDILETAFGDHVMVIATPEGFHVSEYSHK